VIFYNSTNAGQPKFSNPPVIATYATIVNLLDNWTTSEIISQSSGGALVNTCMSFTPLIINKDLDADEIPQLHVNNLDLNTVGGFYWCQILVTQIAPLTEEDPISS